MTAVLCLWGRTVRCAKSRLFWVICPAVFPEFLRYYCCLAKGGGVYVALRSGDVRQKLRPSRLRLGDSVP